MKSYLIIPYAQGIKDTVQATETTLEDGERVEDYKEFFITVNNSHKSPRSLTKYLDWVCRTQPEVDAETLLKLVRKPLYVSMFRTLDELLQNEFEKIPDISEIKAECDISGNIDINGAVIVEVNRIYADPTVYSIDIDDISCIYECKIQDSKLMLTSIGTERLGSEYTEKIINIDKISKQLETREKFLYNETHLVIDEISRYDNKLDLFCLSLKRGFTFDGTVKSLTDSLLLPAVSWEYKKTIYTTDEFISYLNSLM